MDVSGQLHDPAALTP